MSGRSGGRGSSKSQRSPGQTGALRPAKDSRDNANENDLARHVQELQDRAGRHTRKQELKTGWVGEMIQRGAIDDPDAGKFSPKDWRPQVGPQYRFQLRHVIEQKRVDVEEGATEEERDARTKELRQEQQDQRTQDMYKTDPYTDYTGLRFPTLETAANFDYHQDRGLKKLDLREFPIKVPGYRRLDPYLREYIHFLHSLDPVRFTVARIAERYRMREKTVAKVVQEWASNRFLTRSGLTRLSQKQTTKEKVVLRAKEEMYAKWVGWDQIGDEDDPETDDEELGDYRGWRATQDWVRKQNVEVESMSAFPLMAKRDPMPKRVDADLVVESSRTHKIINWIDPHDKVPF